MNETPSRHPAPPKTMKMCRQSISLSAAATMSPEVMSAK